MHCSLRSAALASVIVAGFSVVGCEQPAAPTSLPLGASQNGTEAVTVPMQITAVFDWTVPGASVTDCPSLIDPSTGQLFTAVGSGSGHGTHLGAFEIAQLDHPTINLCGILPPNPPLPTDDDTRRTGVFEFVGADGSSIDGSYTFFLAPPGREDETTFTMFVEGGSGRFDGASGRLEGDIARSGMAVCADPFCLQRATVDPAVFEGAITLQPPVGWGAP
jgi:hypothetical protein